MENVMFLNPFAWDYQVWRIFFLIAALWNFLGIFGMIWPQESFKNMFGKETDDDIMILLYQTLWGSVLLLGIGYLIIAYNPGTNLGLVLLGIIGKIADAYSFILYYRKGLFQKRILVAAIGDLIFCFFFICYLFGGVRTA